MKRRMEMKRKKEIRGNRQNKTKKQVVNWTKLFTLNLLQSPFQSLVVVLKLKYFVPVL